MQRIWPVIRWRTTTAAPIMSGAVRATPVAGTLTVRWRRFGWVWTRPLAVLVERDGQAQRVPIPDLTRRAQAGMLGAALAAGLAALVYRAQKG